MPLRQVKVPLEPQPPLVHVPQVEVGLGRLVAVHGVPKQPNTRLVSNVEVFVSGLRCHANFTISTKKWGLVGFENK